MIFSFDKGIWIDDFFWDDPLWREAINSLSMPHNIMFNQNQGIVDKYGHEIDRALAEHYEGYGARTRVQMMSSGVFTVKVEFEGKRYQYYFEQLLDNKRNILLRVAYSKHVDTLFIREAK